MSNLSPLVIIIFIAAFLVVLMLLLKLTATKGSDRKRKLLKSGAVHDDLMDDEDTLNEVSSSEDFSNIQFLYNLSMKLKQAGLQMTVGGFGILFVILTFSTTVLIGQLLGNYVTGFLIGSILIYSFMNSWLKMKIFKRNQAFLDTFPDALDTIVRSVKSGQPLLSALRLIAEDRNSQIGNEFQKVVDEVSYGSPLADSLHRMAERIGLLDVSFFVVILSVQQETGGNLSEVLSNLSNIVRKRRQLRLKINAMTSEGRFTSWIFAAIPLVQLVIVSLIAPDYIDPLFKTFTGNVLLCVAFGFVAFSVYISKRLCKIDM